MTGFSVEEVGNLGKFIEDIRKLEQQHDFSILLGGNAIWCEGDPVAKVDYDEWGTLRVWPV